MRCSVAVIVLASSFAGTCLVFGPAVLAAEPSSEVTLLGRTRSLTGIDDVLAKPTPMLFLETPLRDVLAVIQDRSDVATTADIQSLDDAACDLDETLVTLESEGIPLASSLDAICELLDLEWIVEDDVIEITTPVGAAARQMARMIDVTDITDDPESLARILEATVKPETWARHGGAGAITSDETRDASTLIVTNSWQVQRGVAGVVERIRKCMAGPQAERGPLGVDGYWSDASNAVAARKALGSPMTLDVVETPLRDCARLVAEKAKVPVTFDWRELDAAAIDLDELVLTGSGRGLRLARLLDRLLAPHELTWDLRHDRLTITTLEAARGRHSVAVYPLGGLLEKGRDVSKLIDTVQATVTPDAWEGTGGEAFVRAYKHRERATPSALVIRHTSAGHKAVDDFLQQLPR
jgi:hypothetical protein